MSKKRGKAATRPAPKKTLNKRVKQPAATARQTRLASESQGRTSQVTIFLFRTASGNRIRTAPQRAYAGPGYVEWTLVNMVDGSDVPVRITWPGGSPFATESIEFKSRQRQSVAGVKSGVYKYVVHALDATEDPELEIPEM